MAGAVSQAGFCIGYAWAARQWGWAGSLLAAGAAFGATTLVPEAVGLSALATFPVIIVVIVVAHLLMPAQPARVVDRAEFPRWDLPALMLAATAFVVGLTSAAPLLGSRLAGLIAPFPLFATVLAAFAHRVQGRDAAVGVLRGLLLGLFAFASFFLTVSLLLPTGIAVSFLAPIAVGLAVQAASLIAGRRLGLA